MDLNKVTLIGNLTRDPETKEVGSKKVVRFGLATNDIWKDKKTNEKKETVIFHNVVAWDGLGETVNKYLKKGNKVFIEGRINNRAYLDKNDVRKTRSEVVARNMIMLSGRSGNNKKILIFPKMFFIDNNVALCEVPTC